MKATIDPLTRDQIRETARMLGRAFEGSPLMRHCIPNHRRRPSVLRSLFGASIRDALPFGTVSVARDGPRVIGGAVWLPPGGYPPSTRRQLRQLIGALTVGPMPLQEIRSSLRYLRASEQAHPKAMHWYLAVLGVDPAFQGAGLGGRLLEPVLERADSEGMPVYLETDREQNLAFYARFRFGLVDTLHPDGPDAPPEWTMWRDPR